MKNKKKVKTAVIVAAAVTGVAGAGGNTEYGRHAFYGLR